MTHYDGKPTRHLRPAAMTAPWPIVETPVAKAHGLKVKQQANTFADAPRVGSERALLPQLLNTSFNEKSMRLGSDAELRRLPCVCLGIPADHMPLTVIPRRSDLDRREKTKRCSSIRSQMERGYNHLLASSKSRRSNVTQVFCSGALCFGADPTAGRQG